MIHHSDVGASFRSRHCLIPDHMCNGIDRFFHCHCVIKILDVCRASQRNGSLSNLDRRRFQIRPSLSELVKQYVFAHTDSKASHTPTPFPNSRHKDKFTTRWTFCIRCALDPTAFVLLARIQRWQQDSRQLSSAFVEDYMIVRRKKMPPTLSNGRRRSA